MNFFIPENLPKLLNIGYKDFLSFFNGFSEGILIVDQSGAIIFYNPTMAKIDELNPEDVLGKNIVEIYDLTNETSVIMESLETQEPIIDRPLLYRTRRGKVANTIHTVFPLFRNNQLQGAICLVREYNVLEETISSISLKRSKKTLPNDTRFHFDDIVGSGIEIQRAVNIAKMAAATPSPVMLCGETGTGKELFAQAIHNQSERKDNLYTAINCAAIPENLLEGLLFGTTSGAFTGARNKIGLFEKASGGTLFLDELNSMTIGLQVKILRIVQERKIRRLGSLQESRIDIKIISSVNKEPHLAIADNTLRPDLFYRLGVVFIPIPPLRERKEDIDLLARHFLSKHNQALNRNVTDISDDVLALFHEYEWPGNVRELEHVIEGAINVVTNTKIIERRHLPSHLTSWHHLYKRSKTNQPPEPKPVREPQVEKYHHHIPMHANKTFENEGSPSGLRAVQAEQEKNMLMEALMKFEGNITKAARSIGISRQLFNYKINKHSILRLRKKSD